jgi:hypothetical protein
MEHTRDWIDILQALLTPTIALIAVGIGLAQWWTARNRLKLDLFDTRWSVYGATRDLLTEMFVGGKVSPETEAIFLRESRGAKWLFDERVDSYLRSELWAKATLLKTANSMLEPTAPPIGREEATRQKNEIMVWLAKQDDVADVLFGPYLKMEESPIEWLHGCFRAERPAKESSRTREPSR